MLRGEGGEKKGESSIPPTKEEKEKRVERVEKNGFRPTSGRPITRKKERAQPPTKGRKKEMFCW